MATLVFCLSFSVVVQIVFGCYMLGIDNWSSGKTVEFYETYPFKQQFGVDFYNAIFIGSENKGAYDKIVKQHKSEIVEEVKNDFINRKAEIIRQELEFAVNNWDAEYYVYEDTVDEILDVTEVTMIYEDEVILSENKVTLPEDADKYITVPEHAPVNVKLASYALNTAKGAEFLKYESLVRERAFTEDSFIYSKDLYLEKNDLTLELHFYPSYSLSEAEVEAEISDTFDSEAENLYEEIYGTYSSKTNLECRKNLKYYIVNQDGEVFANIKEIPLNLSNNTHYILSNGENIKIVGFTDSQYSDALKDKNIETLCLYFDEEFKADDIYSDMFKSYKIIATNKINTLIIKFTALLIVLVALLIVWLRLCGNKAKFDKPRLSVIEKIPNDLHLLLSCGVIIGLTAGFLFLITLVVNDNPIYSFFLSDTESLIVYIYVILVFGLLTELLSSVVRTKKAGESYLKNTLIYKAFSVIKKIFVKFIKVFAYKPKAVKLRFTLLFAGYFTVNILLWVLVVLFFVFEPLLGVFPLIVLFIYNALICYLLVDYVNNLDKIIVASSNRENAELNISGAPRSLKILSDNLSDKNKNLDEAVAEAVKNEHMKTMLITNVSHDLKTPLTSLISYSDLLSKCQIEDDDAKKYVEVINQQSVKLKHLIEDLIEASKVSTGNVVLNKAKLNLSELAVQAIVEFTPDFEKNFNEIKFSEPEKAPIVFADGTKTYRIISNLLSNAKKYSASNTRVYITVYNAEGYGCFEIKNISKEPLNITADELTERFVRGDESRSKEGNGLGLSIAKDLCTLQNGSLDLFIDGDLFKAVVKLPIID